jgi:hypothetical protein
VSWTWSDAWLLTAAYSTQENPVSLRGLIGAGDSINHALFTDDEIDDGLTRLTAAGLARLEGESILLTDDALHLCEEAVKATAYMFEATKAVEAALRKIDLTGKELDPVVVSKPAVVAAIEQYHKDFAREYAELRKRDEGPRQG